MTDPKAIGLGSTQRHVYRRMKEDGCYIIARRSRLNGTMIRLTDGNKENIIKRNVLPSFINRELVKAEVVSTGPDVEIIHYKLT